MGAREQAPRNAPLAGFRRLRLVLATYRCTEALPVVAGKTQTKLADLALLCSNCHRMIHRTKQWLTVEELEELVETQRTNRFQVGGGMQAGKPTHWWR